MASSPETEDLDVVWKQALERYEEITQKPLGDPAQCNFENIKISIHDSLTRSKSANAAKAKNVMNHAMKCLQQFGGVVATSASVVFGPSSQCWNAINFVIVAAQKYQSILDGFVALMERSIAFLDRLQVYLSEKRQDGTYLDPRLRKTAYKVLEHFLSVLGHSYRLTNSKREKFKTALKVFLFNDDAGVGGAMAQMENLVSDLTDLSIAVILKDVEGLAKYMTRSHDEITERLERSQVIIEDSHDILSQLKTRTDADVQLRTRQETLEKIKTSLGIGSMSSLEDIHFVFSRSGKRIEGTGAWLLNNPCFKKWTDISNSNSVMLLTGNEGFGKSYICSHVIDHLRKQYPSDSTLGKEAVLVAHYYFQRDAGESVERCLRSLVYQFAQADETYARAIAPICEQLGTSKAADIWNILTTSSRLDIPCYYFVVIDGFYDGDGQESVEKSVSAIVKSLLDRGRDSFFRMFLSARYEDMALISTDYRRVIQEWRLGQLKPVYTVKNTGSVMRRVLNADDLILMARTRITVLCAADAELKGVLDERSEDMAIELATLVEGDYEALDKSLQELTGITSPDELPNVFARATQSRSEVLRSTIHHLDKSLSLEDLKILNILLSWISADVQADNFRHVHVLECVLHLQLGKKILLKKKIESAFSGLLRVVPYGPGEPPSIVELKSEDLLEILRAEPRAVLAFQKSELAIIERLIRTFCPEDLYERLDFDSFFGNRLSGGPNRIRIPEARVAALDILLTCLRGLCEGSGEVKHKDELFRNIALLTLQYLCPAVDLEKVEKPILRQIGSRLSTLLGDVSVIDAVWCTQSGYNTWGVYRDGSFFVLMKSWLKHPHVMTGYDGDIPHHAWMRSVMAESRGDEGPFSRVAERFFRLWATTTGGFWFGYNLMKWNSSAAKDRTDFVQFGGTESVAKLNHFMSWGLSRLDSAPDAYDYEFQKGTIFLEHGGADDLSHWEAGVAAMKVAANMRPDDVDLLFQLAHGCCDATKYQDALDYIARFKALRRLGTDYQSQMKWSMSARLEARCYRGLGQLPSAVSVLIDQISRFDNNDIEKAKNNGSLNREETIERAGLSCSLGEIMGDLLDIWSRNQQHGDIFKLMLQWSKMDVSGTILMNRLASVPFRYYHGFHRQLSDAATQLHRRDEWCEFYKHALRSYGQLSSDIIPDQERIESFGCDAPFRVYAACVLLQSSLEDDQQNALTIVQSLLQSEELVGVVPEAMNVLANQLQQKAVSTAPTFENTHVSHYHHVLEGLCYVDVAVEASTRGRLYDFNVVMARLHMRKQDTRHAQESLEDLFQQAFDKLPDMDANESRFRLTKLARCLTVLGKDDDALLAWSSLQPELFETELRGENIVVPFERSSGYQPSCDGCGTSWVFISDIYACRDCLSTLLCVKCHGVLQAGEMSPLICSSSHSFLYIPELDKSAWEKKPPGTILVEGRPVSLPWWLDMLREKYQFENNQSNRPRPTKAQGSIQQLVAKFEAARAITKWWKSVKNDRKRRNLKSPS